MKDIFFKLIRSGLYGTELSASDLPTTIDWVQISALAHNHTLEGILADAILRLPSSINVPERVKGKLTQVAFKIAKSHALLDQELSKIVKFYRLEGINTTLLKGQGIASSYRQPVMRQCGDIDLYIGRKNYDRACQLAREKLIKSVNIINETVNETSIHYEFNIGKVTIELHHTAVTSTSFRNKEFQNWVASELDKEREPRHIVINGEEINLPPITFDVFFIFYHAWRHLTLGGIGLRQLCDWSMVLNKHYEEIDLHTLEKALRRFKLMKPWQIFGNIVVNHLGHNPSSMPFYNPSDKSVKAKSNRVLDIILESGNFGYFSAENENVSKLGHNVSFSKNFVKLTRSTKRYLRLAPIIPLDATLIFISQVSNACVKTLAKLLKTKKTKK